MDDCCNCFSLKKQFEDLKQKHLLDFRTIKQKIISTDTLIRSYQEKCQEFDKQKMHVLELTSKLDGAQRSVEVIKLQLRKSLELIEPLQKRCNEFEREKVLQCAEIQALQDRLRGSENLVGQLQSVIKESEVSANSWRLDATLHTGEIEECKKSQKKNEAQISRLNEQVLTEKKANKALNRKLTKSQNQVKTLLDETEESKKLIAKLQEQLNTGKSDNREQRTNTLLEKQIMTLKTEAVEYEKIIQELKEEVCKAKLQNTDENKVKISAENKIKSPTTPRRSPRIRKSVTPKQGKESSAKLERGRPLTRLQQHNLIEEIDKKSSQLKSESISSGQQERLASESESDADETGTLLDTVNEMLDIPYCPSLSPLPPSPFLDGSSVGENNDADYICDDNGVDDNAVDNGNHDIQNYIDDSANIDDNKSYSNDGNDNMSTDNIGDFDNFNKDDDAESRGKKRELGESTTSEFGETFMTLRSRKRLKSGNSDIDSEPFSKEEDEHEVSRTLKRTKSVETKQELNTPEVNVLVTRSKSLDETTEAVLEMKPKRRRRKQRLSSDDEGHEQSFKSSDTSAIENNVFEISKHSSDKISTAENNVSKTSKQSADTTAENNVEPTKHSEDSSEEKSNNKKKENGPFQEIPSKARTRSMDKLGNQDTVDEEVSKKDEEVSRKDEEVSRKDETSSSGTKVPTVKNQTASETLILGKDLIMESPNELGNSDAVAEETVSGKSAEAKVPATINPSNIETLTSTETLIIIRPPTRTTHELPEKGKGANSKEEDSSDVKDPPTENETNMETVTPEVLHNNCSEKRVPVFEENSRAAETTHRDEVLKCLQHISDSVANETRGNISMTDVTTNLIHPESCTDSRGQKEFMDCLNAFTDSVVKSDNNSSTLQAEIDCVRPLTRHDSKVLKDDNKENKTAKTSDFIDKYDTTVGTEINQSIKNPESSSKSSGNGNMAHTRIRKHKTDTTSECVSTINKKEESEITTIDDHRKSSLGGSEFVKPPSHNLVSNNTRKIQYEASKEITSTSQSKANIVSEKSSMHISDEDPTILDGITSTMSPPRDSFDSLEEELERTTPLSPIPDTPKKSGRSAEIPCFDSLDHLPLSPIPPSPPPRTDEECINLACDENVDQSPREPQVNMQQKLNRNELPNDVLRRYPGVNEPQYTVFILTKLKNKEITLADLITAFSVQRNVKNHTPICNGIITVLKLTQEDKEHALMEKYAEHYEHGEWTGEPVVSEFEMQVLIAVKRLCNIQRHSNLLKKLVKWLGMNLCELFNSGNNDAGLLAICRMYAGVCRLMGEGSRIRVLCYDILKQNKRYSITERMILAIALVWPKMLCETADTTIKVNPFLSTLLVILMTREMSCGQTRRCLEQLLNWRDMYIEPPSLEEWASDLVCELRFANDTTSERYPDCSSTTIGNTMFEIIKCLELLATVMGWEWTNDVLIRRMLWPVFKEWTTQGFDAKQETILDSESKKREHVLNTKDTPNLFEATNIADILRLLGVLGCERLQKGEMINLDAVINLMCAIVTSSSCEKVSFRVQHAAASALLNLIKADPVKITQVLKEWITRGSKIDETLTGQFERRMKEVRTHMWTS